MISEYEANRRLHLIESALEAKGFAAAADERNGTVAVLPATGECNHDCDELWDKASSAFVLELTREDLSSETYLEIALRRVTAHYGH